MSVDLIRCETSNSSKKLWSLVGETGDYPLTLGVVALWYSLAPKEVDSTCDEWEGKPTHHESNIIASEETTSRTIEPKGGNDYD